MNTLTSNVEHPYDRSRRLIAILHHLRPWSGACAIVVAQLGTHWQSLSGVAASPHLPVGSAISPHSALSISLIGAALIVSGLDGPFWMPAAVPVPSSVFALLSVLPFLLHLSQLGEGSLHAEMGLDTHLVLLALVCVILTHKRYINLAAPLALFACGLLANSIIGATYGIPYFGGKMATATMVALTFAALGALTLCADYRPIRVIFLDTDIGQSTRILALRGTTIVWLCGYILHQTSRVIESYFPLEALLFTLIIASNIVIATRAGNKLETSDRQRRKAERKLATLAATDPLTHLLNRSGIQPIIDAKVVQLRHGSPNVAVALMDIDHFKSINDTYGHSIGDLVLANIKQAITPHLRQGDYVARWGGEEFLFLLDNTGPDDLYVPLERMRQAMISLSERLNIQQDGVTLRITGSFGVSFVMDSEQNLDGAIIRADKALYQAKRSGRNQVVFNHATQKTKPDTSGPSAAPAAKRNATQVTRQLRNSG